MGSIVVVQQIRTRWTKTSRGGQNAQRRNAVPEIARVPVERINRGNHTGVRHRLWYDERDQFAHPNEEVCVDPTMNPLVIGCVTIDHHDEQVTATFHYDRRCGGAPDRGWASKTLCLAVNEWGQMAYNGRFNGGWESPWYYEKMVVNVGLFERLTPGVFTQQEPVCRYAAIGYLV